MNVIDSTRKKDVKFLRYGASVISSDNLFYKVGATLLNAQLP